MDTSTKEALLRVGVNTIAQLEATIKEASEAYYSTGKSPLTDAAWDAMVALLQDIHPASPILHKTGWGYAPLPDTVGTKVKHLYGEVGSLDKAYKFDDLSKDILKAAQQPEECELSLKLDGLSLVAYYQKGIRMATITRGDGFIGIDVTDKTEDLVPARIWDSDFTGAVRGELMMTKSDWDKFKTLHPEAKNPRNSVAGLINGKEVSEDLKYVTWMVYTVIGLQANNAANLAPDERGNISTTAINQWLHHNFPNVVPTMGFNALSQSVTDQFEYCVEVLNPDKLYPTDGLVMKGGLATLQDNGKVAYTMQAWKFPAEKATTRVREVEWNLSKTKYLIPRLIVDTVFISGTNASAATGYNAKYILDNSIGVGAEIEISKHGEIIPNVDRIITPATQTDLPICCPSCGEPLTWDGVHLKCPNPACTDGAVKDTLIWMETLVPMDGMGSKTREKFLDYYIGIQNLSVDRLMDTKMNGAEFFDDLRQSASTKTALQFIDNWLKLLDKNTTFTATAAFRALNIPRLGDVSSSKLADAVDLARHVIIDANHAFDAGNGQTLSPGTAFEMTKLLGEATTASIMAHPDKFRLLGYISDRIVFPEKSTKEIRQVAVTGTLSVPRDQFETMIEPAGFIIGDLKKSTFCLITDNPNSGSSKNIKADKYGVPKMTEQEFFQKYITGGDPEL